MIQQIRFSGYGGQGIIRLGLIVGKAASLFDEKNATMTQSFGPEARGSACSSQLVVSDDPVLYPYLTEADILVAMSQEAHDKFLPGLRPGGILLVDEDLVKKRASGEIYSVFSIPATRMAEELGNKVVGNVVMLGFFTVVTRIVSAQAMKKAIPGSVPDRAVELNLKAFDAGAACGDAQVETGRERVLFMQQAG